MVCDECGRVEPIVGEHAYEGLDLCSQCVKDLEMRKSSDKKVTASMVTAYRSRRARVKGETA